MTPNSGGIRSRRRIHRVGHTGLVFPLIDRPRGLPLPGTGTREGFDPMMRMVDRFSTIRSSAIRSFEWMARPTTAS